MQNSRKREIRKKADFFRDKCKVSRYGIINLFIECERCGYKLIRYPLDENADLGFAMKRGHDIIIFTNTSIRLSREIFTLAHEIGHIILHMDSADAYIDNKSTLYGREIDEKEQEANYFAACLLMPDDEVDRFLDREIEEFNENGLSAMDIAKIMSEFSVSFDMALNRLQNLEKITKDERILLDNKRNHTCVGRLLQSVGGNNRLNESSMEMNIPHEYMSYVIYNYNHNAIPMETLEKVLAYYKLSAEDVSDKLIKHSVDDDELDDLIGGLED